ncbi:DNA helicase [Tanacetum coccineum]
MDEKNYKRDLLREEEAESVPKLNHDQRKIFNLIISASTTNGQELLFVYGHGGTGKIFLWRTTISSLRSHGKIVLDVTSSGIASLLLPAGRTTHSRFKLPLELTNKSLCHAKKKIKKGASKEELIATSIAKSHLWPHFKICTLKENMRLIRSGLTTEEKRRSEQFTKWLLDMGNGEIGEPDAENEQDSSWVTIPPKYTITTDEAGMSELIDFIYDDTTLKAPTAGSLQEKAIVCPKNETADVVNAKILSSIEGQSKTYSSNDEAISLGRETSETELLYPIEYQNTMTFPRLPPHELELKVGTPIMLLRNVNLSGGLCNGTRMIVRSLMSKQFRTMSTAIIASLRIGQENCILEAKVYQIWISKSVSDMKALAYCFIMIDRENNAIQATMDLNNIDYFNQLLQPHAAYRISNFICERTKSYQQTLENQITLRFGKITVFEPLPGKESKFPDHHFKLISYYQLPSRVPYRDENSKLIYPILTDYLGRFRSISDIIPFGTPTISEKYLRKLDTKDPDECSKASTQQNGTYVCEDHGKQDPVTYRYKSRQRPMMEQQ